MSSLVDVHERPALEAPVLVVGLEGWIDAGLAAAGAVQGLLEALDTRPIATFDADLLLDHRARRPVLHLEEGVNTSLRWPSVELRAGQDAGGNDLLLLVGAEPDNQWRGFCRTVVELAAAFGTRMAVGLGAYPAPVPHTRPTRLACTCSTAEVARTLPYIKATLDVPAGVQAVLEHEFAEAGVPALTLWAQVPHYAATMPFPSASAALVRALASTAGLALEVTDLDESAEATRRRIDALVGDSPDHVRMVQELEHRFDAQADENLPSGDELAAELERFLREQGGPDT